MAKTAAARSREKRERQKRGEHIERVSVSEGQVVVVIDQGQLAEALRDAQLIQDWSMEERAEVEAALLKAIARLRHA